MTDYDDWRSYYTDEELAETPAERKARLAATPVKAGAASKDAGNLFSSAARPAARPAASPSGSSAPGTTIVWTHGPSTSTRELPQSGSASNGQITCQKCGRQFKTRGFHFHAKACK